MRTFGQVPLALWRKPHFMTLADDARLALLFMWCGPHSTSAGVYVLPDGYAAIDLGWELSRWEDARSEIEEAGFIARDPETQTVLVRDYFTTNRPSNARHLAAIRNQIAAVACPALRDEAERALDEIAPRPAAPQGNVKHLETPYMQRAGR